MNWVTEMSNIDCPNGNADNSYDLSSYKNHLLSILKSASMPDTVKGCFTSRWSSRIPKACKNTGVFIQPGI